jgi:hypothetical protein
MSRMGALGTCIPMMQKMRAGRAGSLELLQEA